jgi:hypothetical protein
MRAWRKIVAPSSWWLAENDARWSLAYQLRQPLLTAAEWQGTDIIAVEFQQIEGIQHSIASMTAPRRCVRSKVATLSGPDTMASTSNVKDWAASFAAASLMAG